MRKHNTLKWLLTGALMLTAITACGKENSKNPDTSQPVISDAGAQVSEGTATSSVDTNADIDQESSSVFDLAKVPALTKQQKYISDNADADKVSFMLASNHYSDAPNVFVGIDLPGSAELHFHVDNGYMKESPTWKTENGSISITKILIYSNEPDYKIRDALADAAKNYEVVVINE